MAEQQPPEETTEETSTEETTAEAGDEQQPTLPPTDSTLVNIVLRGVEALIGIQTSVVNIETALSDVTIQGPQGEVGPQGQLGAQGPKGDRGDPGMTGERGPAGPRGQEGNDGDPGPAGPQGLKGDPGEDGQDGRDGQTGPAGPRGPKGEKGDKGDPGRDGMNGADGQDGQDGETGPAGPAGSQGPRGPKGDKGLKGNPGEDGQDGRDGQTGPAGPRGPKGEKGDKGDPGRDGMNGADGQDGQDGETGPAGPAGPQGPKGPKGDKGLKGDPGEDGQDGRDLTVSDLDIQHTDVDDGGDSRTGLKTVLLTKTGNTITVKRTHNTTDNCFFPGTLIRMADGQNKAVEEIAIGDKLYSPDGDQEVVALDKGIFTGKSKARVQIRFEIDRGAYKAEIPVTCTANHPFMLPDGSFGAVDPNTQGDNRVFNPIVSNDGRRELWRRGNRGDVKVLSVGDEVAVTGEGKAVVTEIVTFEFDPERDAVPVTSPVTGGLLSLMGGILASGGYDTATAKMEDPRQVVEHFAVMQPDRRVA